MASPESHSYPMETNMQERVYILTFDSPLTHRFRHHRGLGPEVLSLHGVWGWQSPHPTDLFRSCTGVSRSHPGTYTQVNVQVLSPGFGKRSLCLWEPTTRTEWNHPRAWVLCCPGSVMTEVANQEHLVSVPLKIFFYRITLE